MRTRSHVLAAVAVFSSLFTISAYAQEPAPPQAAAAPPNLAYVEGSVDVVHDGVTERADPPFMLLEGDVVRTRNGRAEIVFGDGTLVHLGEDSEFEVLDDDHLRLRTGRAIFRVSHSASRSYLIDTPASSVRLDPQGEYRVTANATPHLDVAVTRGTATIEDPAPWTIRGGQRLSLDGPNGRPLIETFNSARWDAFTTWSYERTNGFAASPSSAQLPYELRSYAPVLDSYGRWDYLAPHGYVWFPSVAADWRPYYDGSWAFTRYGWTWHGHDRWAWPTHHYGRWGFTGSFWYWMPAATWSPAWVTWSFAPGYVSWAPLGWDNRAAIGWWGRPDHPAYWPDYTPGRAWTIVPRNRFGPRRDVRADAIGIDRLDDISRRTLADSVVPPAVNNVAVPRDSIMTATPRGNVRRPPRTYPSNGAVDSVTPPSSVPSATPPPTTPAEPRSRRPQDAPAYAPPRSWNSGDGDGDNRRSPGEGASPRERPRGTPRPQPQTAPPPDAAGSAPPPSERGAGERSGASRRAAPRTGAPAGSGTTAPPPSGSAPSQGSARRRPGA